MDQNLLNLLTVSKFIDLALQGRKCPDGYLDRVLYWAQKGDLDPLIELFDNRKSSLRLKPTMLNLLAEILRRVKPDKNIARMETAERRLEIALFVHVHKDQIGLMKAYKKAAKKFGYKNTKDDDPRQIRAIYRECKRFIEQHLWKLESLNYLDLEAKNALKKLLQQRHTSGIIGYEVRN